MKYKSKSLVSPGHCVSDQLTSMFSVINSMEKSQPKDTQSHVLVCHAYSNIHSSIELDPMNDEHMADYFIKVVQRRVENGDDR